MQVTSPTARGIVCHRMGRKNRYFWFAMTLVAVSACSGCGSGPGAPASGASLQSSETEVELFEVGFGGRVEVGGQTFWFSGMTPPEHGGPSATLSLGESSSDPTVNLLDGGCTYHDGWVYALLALSGPTSQQGRFARRRAGPDPAELQYGVEAELGESWAARVPSGFTARLVRVHPLDDGTWTVRLDTRLGERELEVNVTAPAGDRAMEARRIGDHILTIRVGEGAGPLGCPSVRLTLELPSAQIVEVQDGEVVVLRRGASAALGDLRVRYLGLIEGITVEGAHLAFAQLEVTVGGRSQNVECPVGENTAVEGFVIEALIAGSEQAQLRLRNP